MKNKEKVLVGISGGVDSSVALYLLQQQGYEPVGITLKVIEDTSQSKFDGELKRTQALCQSLGIKHIIKHVEPTFYREIIMNFVETYLDGETPNPCVICNKVIKWRFMLQMADELGIDKIATGHYARIVADDGTYYLHSGKDSKKDQSYMLWQLGQAELSRSLFPLGDYLKSEIKKIAKEHELVPESLSESQDVCFIPENDYRNYLQENFPNKLKAVGKGKLVNTAGEILGEHDGFYNFTIGQRKGFKRGFSGRRYVKKIDAANNRIIITTNDDLFSRGLVMKNYNFPSEQLIEQFKGAIKIRYNHTAVDCAGYLMDETNSEILFDTPQRAVTPGQSAVVYQGNRVLLGGIIRDIL